MKPIIAITHAFPPLKFPQSIQMYRLLWGLAEKGHPVSVFHAAPDSIIGQSDSSLKTIPNHPNITRIPVCAYENRRSVRLANSIFRWLKYLPDERNPWILPAYLAARRYIRESGVQPIIISFSNPWSDHLIGLGLKRTFGFPWVTHFSDPWTDNPYVYWHSSLRKVQNWMERTVIGAADQVIFVSEETRALVMGKYPAEFMEKSRVLPHMMGYEMDALASRIDTRKKFTLCHAGEFYGPRTPLPLFRALHRLLNENPRLAEKISIRLVGGMQEKYAQMITELKLESIVDRIKPVPYLESLEYISDADVLMIIDAPTRGPSLFLPSKIVDYFSAKHPILGITPLQGASARVIREMNGVVADPEDTDGIYRAILGMYSAFRDGNLEALHGYGEEKIRQYTISRVAEDLSTVLETV
jgi:glycosyltransferase involved in cell wall biosynthesis